MREHKDIMERKVRKKKKSIQKCLVEENCSLSYFNIETTPIVRLNVKKSIFKENMIKFKNNLQIVLK